MTAEQSATAGVLPRVDSSRADWTVQRVPSKPEAEVSR
jgi:hypothetical protein